MVEEPSRRPSAGVGGDDDRFGFDEATSSPGSYLGSFLGKFVPPGLAKRALSASIETDRDRYAVGESVAFTVEFYNPLPVAVALRTSGRRLWGWTVDGDLEGSDEPRYTTDRSRVVRFGGRERKSVRQEWSGLFKRTGDPTEWVDPDPGTYELGAYLNVGADRPEATTTIRIG